MTFLQVPPSTNRADNLHIYNTGQYKHCMAATPSLKTHEIFLFKWCRFVSIIAIVFVRWLEAFLIAIMLRVYGRNVSHKNKYQPPTPFNFAAKLPKALKVIRVNIHMRFYSISKLSKASTVFFYATIQKDTPTSENIWSGPETWTHSLTLKNILHLPTSNFCPLILFNFSIVRNHCVSC